jgi:hypothetical protein
MWFAGCMDGLCLCAQIQGGVTCVSDSGKFCALLLRWMRGLLVPTLSDTGWGDVRQH